MFDDPPIFDGPLSPLAALLAAVFILGVALFVAARPNDIKSSSQLWVAVCLVAVVPVAVLAVTVPSLIYQTCDPDTGENC